LFTDVEGSTRRWEADADGMRVALSAHDALLRSAIETHRGSMFKHTRDGVCRLASPRLAVDAAVNAQRARAVGDRADSGHQPRRTGDHRRAVVAGALARCWHKNRLVGGDSVRRTGASRFAALRDGVAPRTQLAAKDNEIRTLKAKLHEQESTIALLYGQLDSAAT